MKNISAIFVVLFITLLMSFPLWALGNSSTSYTQASGSSSKQNKVNSSSQAASIVKSRTGGKVLKVNKNGRSGYKVKVIKPNGHIISVTVDAKSGKVKGK